ncbi:O-antigen translocase [Pontibacter sp. MBLB2868]|uniref:O-antigen translocase n=1 Tax=Pontibacter sp. MBLB2868 TaxID=3451555 RepID=UPI003F74BEA6
MFAVISKVLKKDIVKVFSLNAISTLVKMLTGFVSVKVVAVLIGPAGIALLGQLTNFSTIFLTVSTGGINNGVTKYIAENAGSDKVLATFLRTSFWITLVLSSLCAAILILGASFFSQLIFDDTQYTFTIVVFGCTLALYSFNALLLSIINGFKEFRKYVVVNIVSSLFGLLFSASLTLAFGVYGALLAAVTFQSVVFFVTLALTVKSNWFKKSNFIGEFNPSAGKKLAHYSVMALATASTGPISQLIVRRYITDNVSLTDAGLWEGINRISGMYLLLITSSLVIYYLPRLSEIKNDIELKKEILEVYKIIVPVLLVITLSTYLLKDWVIYILFDDQFQGMQPLFAFQLIGDFFKIISWILAFQMVAKSMTATFVATEVIFSIMFVFLGLFFVEKFGTVGATIGHSITYIIYFLTMVIIFRKVMLSKV